MKRKAKDTVAENNGVPADVAEQKRKNLIRGSVIFTLCGLFFYFFARIGIDIHHDGVMLYPAVQVAKGAAVFRDVFCQYGLLVPLIQGLAVALFGTELMIIRVVTVLFYAGSAVLLDCCWRRFLPSRISWLLPVMFCLFAACTMVTFHSWNSVYAMFFMLLTGYFAIRYLEKDNSPRKWLFFAGISAGLTWACRTPCGMVTVFALFLVFCGLNFFTGKEKKLIFKELLMLAAGSLSVAVLGFGYILLNGAWDDFIKQSFGYVSDFVYERGGNASWKYFCESMFPIYQEEYWFTNSFFAVLPLAAITLLYISCRNGFLDGKEVMKKELPLAMLLILALGSWHQYYPVPCVRHLYWGGVPLFGAFLLALNKLWQLKNIKYYSFSVILILIALLGAAPRFFGMYNRTEFGKRITVDIPGIRGIRLNPGEYHIVELARCAGNRPVLNWSEDSLLTLVTRQCDIKDVQFYRFETPQYPGYDSRMLEYIFKKRPAVLTDHPTMIPGYKMIYWAEYIGKDYFMQIPEE